MIVFIVSYYTESYLENKSSHLDSVNRKGEILILNSSGYESSNPRGMNCVMY